MQEICLIPWTTIFLGHVIGGFKPIAIGCMQCLGSNIRVLANRKFDRHIWLNRCRED